MKTIKEITIFTNGDSSKISTWSNVPFFFTSTLEKKGVKINRVDISPESRYERTFNRILKRVLDKIYRGKNTYDYFRSSIHFQITRSKIKKAIKTYPHSDAFVFLTFSFSAARLTNKPSIQFCDWTYDHYFKYFERREPNYFERQSIQRENNQINNSDLVFPLFPGVAEYMSKKYTSKIVYLGNVINAVYKPTETEILEIKAHSNNILFIGSPKYIEGANALLEAYTLLKESHPTISLHFIGLNEKHLQQRPSDVYFYGYLDKADSNQRELYYKLLREAKVFVNTTPKWSAFSASIEAMYFYTPIIVPAYKEFINTFGTTFKGGEFCDDNSHLTEKIDSILKSQTYNQLCTNANKLVNEFTWENYIDKLLTATEKHMRAKSYPN